MIDNKRSQNQSDKKIWTRGIIASKTDTHYIVMVAEEIRGISVKKGSFEIAQVGTMTKDYDWRINLNISKFS